MRKMVNLVFHGIDDPPRQLEPGEERVWVTSRQLEFALDSVAEHPWVGISFDDGNASDLRIALPSLAQRNLKAIFFITVGRLNVPGYLDPHGVRELSRAGMVIGCHGMTHQRWRGLPAVRLREETLDAKNALEQVLGHAVTTVACPYGSYDRRSLFACRQAGYRHVLTCDRLSSSPDAWLQHRSMIFRHHNAAGILHIIDGELHGLRLIRQRLRVLLKHWI
ncbi:MAG: polysaccharide deacetylase family protein [Planctomycetota bacterium]|nr:polysaccharide deacetylase family protein [Planctomycetota bacterium]